MVSKSVFMIPAAPQVQGRERTAPPDTSNEQAGQSTPDLLSDTRKLESQNGEDEDQGTAARRECRCPGIILTFIDIDQLRREIGRILLLGVAVFCGMLHGRPYRHSILSKLSWVRSQ